MKEILLIDDDVYIGDMLEEVLSKKEYAVSRAYSGTEALLYLSAHRPDLILLDLMLPGLNGEEILPQLREIPVIVVSAKTDIHDKVALLSDGAVDYVTKPFDTRELLARIEVQLRKQKSQSAQEILTFGALRMDTAAHTVLVGNEPVHLTRTEYAVLKLLLQNSAQVVTKSLLLDHISANTPDCVENSLKVHVSNLRRKLREIDGRDYIESVWGIGFKMKS